MRINDTSIASSSQSSRLADSQSVRFALVLAAYFLMQLLIRLSLSDSLDLDEAEQVFEAQRLRLGYGTQPPLYNWLQWMLFSVLGMNLLALSALKNLLLFSTYLSMFLLARPLVGSAAAAAVSASLLLLPQIGWEAQRDLTHSVLLTTIAAASLWAYFALLRRPSALRYAVFGLLIGLGLQTKYNFVIFSSALVLASLLVPQHRAVVWNRRIGISVAVATLCLLPHGLWVLDHIGLAAGGTIEQMKDEVTGSYLSSVIAGLGSLLLAAASFLTPLWIIYGLICRPYFRRTLLQRPGPDAMFLLLMYAGCFALIAAIVLSGEVTKVKDRWMQPILFSAPLAFFLLLPALARPIVLRRIMLVCGVVAVCIMAGLILRVQLGPSLGKYVRAHHPYPELSAELARRYPQAHTVVASDKLIAGNLHFQRPALRTALLERVVQEGTPLAGELLLVMPFRTGPETLERFVSAFPDAERGQWEQISLPYRYGARDEMSFQVMHLVLPASSRP